MTSNHLLLYRLAELMLQNEQHIQPVDLLFDDEQIGDFVKSIQIDSPYQQMLLEGVLTESVREEKLYVSFTVEGYFHFVLGEVIYNRTEGLGAEALKLIVEENKLNGTKEGVEQCLIRDVQKDDLTKIVWLIDNLNDYLNLIIKPLAFSFAFIDSLSDQREKEFSHIQKKIKDKLILLFKNSTKNDFYVLDGVLNFLKVHSKNNLIITVCVMLLNHLELNNKSQKLIIKCLGFVEYKLAERFFEQIEKNINKVNLDNSTIYLIVKFYINNSKFVEANEFLKNIDVTADISLGFIKSQLKLHFGEFKEGVEYAKELFENIEIPEQKASFANLIGQGYLKLKDFENALIFHHIAVKSALNQFGKYSEDYSIYLNNLSTVYYWIGDYTKSIELMRNVEKIRKNILPENDLKIANIQINLGETLRKIEDYEQALNYQKGALQIIRLKLPYFSIESSAVETNIGLIYENWKNYKKGIYHHFRSLIHKKSILPSNHPSFAESYFEIGKCLIELSRFQDAIRFLLLGYKILHHPNFILNIMQCYEEIKDFKSINYHLSKNIMELQSSNYKTSSAFKSLLEFYEKQLILNNIVNNEDVNTIIKNDL
jgi:tetratricopeptide (TPR) repeat protein